MIHHKNWSVTECKTFCISIRYQSHVSLFPAPDYLWWTTMFGGLRGLVKHLRSSSAVFVYVIALYFILMVHQVPISALDCLGKVDGPNRLDELDLIFRWGQLKL